MASEAQRRASAKYDAKNTKTYSIKLNRNTDADLIEKLNTVTSVQGYIKDLIRKNIK